MFSQSLQCVLCVETYNLQEHTPRVLVQCGHTLCTKCLKAIIARPNASCPLDKTKFKAEYQSIDAFPINFALRDQIEESLGWDICQKHGNRMEVLCLSDETRLCLHCAFFEGHKNHDIKHTSEVEFEVFAKKKELEKSLVNLSEFEKVISNKLESSKMNLLKLISDRFQELSFLLKAKRRELTTQVETLYQILREDRGNPLRSTILDKIKKIDNIESLLKSQSVFSIIKGQVLNFAYQEDQALNSSIEDLESQLNTLSSTLNENFALPIDFLTQLSLPIEDYKSHIHKFYSQLENNSRFFSEVEHQEKEGRQNLIVETKPAIPLALPNTLKIQATDGCLNIVAERDQSFSMINLENNNMLNNISEVRLRIRDWDLQTENIEVIQQIFTKLEAVSSISIHSAEQNIADDYLIQLFEGVFQKTHLLEKIYLDFKMSKLGNNALSYFSESVLVKAEKLNSLHLNLNKTQVNPSFLKAISKSLKHLEKSLNIFELHLSHSDAQEEQLANLFVELSNVTKAVLVFSHTNLDDEGLVEFAKVMLASMKRLESLELRLSSTRVGNQSMEMVVSVLSKLKSLQHLSFNLSSTNVKPAMKSKITQLEQEIALNLD